MQSCHTRRVRRRVGSSRGLRSQRFLPRNSGRRSGFCDEDADDPSSLSASSPWNLRNVSAAFFCSISDLEIGCYRRSFYHLAWTVSYKIMKKTIVKAAAVQISPVLYSRQGTVEKVVKKIRELGKQGVQFATFPETIVPYYPYFSYVLAPFALAKEHLRLLEESVTVPSAETQAIAEAAKEANMVVSIGVNERDGGSIYNTQLLFDADGKLIQRRRKLTPTYNERILWGQGDGSGLCAIDSAVGRIGQLACWEHNNPLARYALIADGEQIHSAMYPGSFAEPQQ